MRASDALARAAALFPDDPAIDDGARVWTWADLRDGAARVAGFLAARGVGPGDRVALLGGNDLHLAVRQ